MKSIIFDNIGFMLVSYICVPLLILGNITLKDKNSFQCILEKNEVIYLKGISALFIVIHHLSQRIEMNLLVFPWIEIGKYVVALFLFISGYGLMKSQGNNSRYLNNFICNRLMKIYIPFVLSNLIMIIINIIKGDSYGIIDLLFYIFGIKLIDSSMWYIIFIIFCYIIFYLSFKKTKIDRGIKILFICNIIYYIFAIISKLPTVFINISFCFFIGVYFEYREEKIINYIYNKKAKLLLINTLVCISSRILSILIPEKYILIDMIFANVSTIFFVFTIIIMLQFIKFDSKIILLLGNISFSIYLLHNKVMRIIVNINSSLYSIIIYFITLILVSVVFNKIIISKGISNKIKGYINSKRNSIMSVKE